MKKAILVLALIHNVISLPNFLYAQKLNLRWCIVGDRNRDSIVSGEVNNSTNFPLTNRLNNSNGKIIIPVVFHVLYHSSIPAQNVLDYYINDQLAKLNIDFNGTNGGSIPAVWSGLKANMNFEFKLACIDPQGNPTTGSIRKELSNPTTFCYPALTSGACPSAQLNALGGSDAWPTDTYLNIWICDIDTYLGFGMMPDERNGSTTVDINGTPTSIPNTAFDGVVLDYTVFPEPPSTPGEYPMSLHYRKLTHEVGHWLGLYHIYNGCGTNPNDGDKVADTPPQDLVNYTCPNFPTSGGNCSQQSPGAMFMNFMDQTSSICMRLFTIGQKERARNCYVNSNGVRYPFLENYFGIKHFGTSPHIVQNNTITVYMRNHACLNVTYSFSGSASEISHDNQKIVLSVPCPSTGSISLTAVSGDYIDDYTFSFDNSQCGSCPLPAITPVGPITYYYQYESPQDFTLSCSQATSYQWYKDNVLIPGETNQTYIITYDFLNSGTNFYKCVTPCGTSNSVSFTNIPVYNTSEFPMLIESPVCQSSVVAPNYLQLNAPYLGSGTVYNWWPENLFGFGGITINSTGELTFDPNSFNPANYNWQYIDGIYTKSSLSNGTEVYVYYYLTIPTTCRPYLNKTSIAKDETVYQPKAYPNPANTKITITSPFEMKKIEVFNISGTTIYTLNVYKTNQVVIDTYNFKAGQYIFKISGNNDTKYIKILILH